MEYFIENEYAKFCKSKENDGKTENCIKEHLCLIHAYISVTRIHICVAEYMLTRKFIVKHNHPRSDIISINPVTMFTHANLDGCRRNINYLKGRNLRGQKISRNSRK